MGWLCKSGSFQVYVYVKENWEVAILTQISQMNCEEHRKEI